MNISHNQNSQAQSQLKKIKNERAAILQEKRSKFLMNTYNKIRKGKYESVEQYMRQYLKDIKELDSKEEDTIINYYNYKNLKNNLLELNMKVKDEKKKKKIKINYINQKNIQIFIY